MRIRIDKKNFLKAFSYFPFYLLFGSVLLPFSVQAGSGSASPSISADKPTVVQPDFANPDCMSYYKTNGYPYSAPQLFLRKICEKLVSCCDNSKACNGLPQWSSQSQGYLPPDPVDKCALLILYVPSDTINQPAWWNFMGIPFEDNKEKSITYANYFYHLIQTGVYQIQEPNFCPCLAEIGSQSCEVFEEVLLNPANAENLGILIPQSGTCPNVFAKKIDIAPLRVDIPVKQQIQINPVPSSQTR